MKITAAMIYIRMVGKTCVSIPLLQCNTTCILVRNFHDNIGHVYDFQYISVRRVNLLYDLTMFYYLNSILYHNV
jgi:hypothetical protein